MSIKAVRADDGIVMFWCPGCETSHGISDELGRWTFNGDFESPTISPSILAQGVIRCHSYVENGQIRFLSDSQHKLAGQTVEIPEWPFL